MDKSISFSDNLTVGYRVAHFRDVGADLRWLLPPSSSALILTEAELEELDELLEGWEHAAHSLSDQNRTDQE